MKKPKEKPKYNFRQNTAYIVAAAWKKEKYIIFSCLIMATLIVLRNLVNLLIAPVILGAIESSAPLIELVVTILLFSAALIIIIGADRYFVTTIIGRQDLRYVFNFEVHQKHMTMSYPLTQNQDVLKKLDRARMISWSENSIETIWDNFSTLLANSAGIIIYLVLLAAIDPVVLGVVLVTTVPSFFIGKYINGWGYRHRDEESEYSRRMNYVNDKASDMSLAKDIRLFNMKGWLDDVYRSALRLYGSFASRREKAYIWGDIVDLVLTFIRNGAAYLFLINMVINDGLSASQFLLLFAAVGGLAQWMVGIISQFSVLHMFSLNMTALREYLEYPETFLFEDGENIEPNNAKAYELELRGVSFMYPGAETHILKNINLTAKTGDKLAVVGLNGAGKTTLVKLMCGFLDPTEGEVLLNGVNIKQLNRRDYYRHFSAVFQEFSVLPASIGENIAQTPLSASSPPDIINKIRECAQKADIADKIESLPDGYDTKIGKDVYDDATDLSGGEIQRLMLARALYKDAPIIVLDEPTAALDPIAESTIYSRYNELTLGKMAVYISHRLASTRFCGKVILIDKNIIAEEGTHDELVKRGGTYAELFEVQSRYYRRLS